MRRTIFNISIDVINKHVENMNRQAQMNNSMDQATILDNMSSNKPIDATAMHTPTSSPLPMKRKLFTPPVTIKLSEITLKRSRDNDIQSGSTTKKPKISSPIHIEKTDRVSTRPTRRTTMNFRLESATKKVSKVSGGRRISQSVLVFTNMHTPQIDLIKKVD